MSQACRSLVRVLAKPGNATRRSPSLGLQRLFRRAEGHRVSSLPVQQWQKVSTSCGWLPVTYPQFESYPALFSKLFSTASPATEKDGNPESPIEEACASGEEKVEPVIEGKPESSKNAESGKEEKEKVDEESIRKSIAQLEALIAEKDSNLAELKERALATKAELESVKQRLQRESEASKKYAIQGFAKNLLDLADNLGRAQSTIPENVCKALATDQSENGKLLRSVLEGVTLTEKELMKVFTKFGIKKFEPIGQQFDPNSHLALFEVPDPSKDPGTVAMVTKVGYMLHDRVLRPAEVGVVKSLE